MNALDHIMSENERILWQGEITKEGLKRIKVKIILLYLSIVLSLTLLAIAIINLMNSLVLLIIFISIVFAYGIISSQFAFTYELNYNELKDGLEYYITDQKEFDLTIPKESSCVYESQQLHYKNIDKIVIRRLRIKKNNFAHIDFYSKYIIDNQEEVYIKINIVKNEVDSNDAWRNSQSFKKQRFWYVKDYKEVVEILRQIVPDKVQIEKR